MTETKSLAEIIGGQTEFTKKTVSDVADAIMSEYQSARINPLDFLGKLEFMSQSLEQAISQIREEIVGELEKYGTEAKVGVVRSGITFKLKENGVKYDYSNSQLWQVKNAELNVVKEDVKSLEAQLKALKGKQTIVDEQTGECYENYPPIKSSKTSVEISIPKG